MSRLSAYRAVSSALASYGDRELRDLLDRGSPIGSGIGGRSVLVEVAGVPVFVKRVPLTDLERRPSHVRSTANLFGLPEFCQYGIGAIGSPGFGAWRELAVHLETTDWVLSGAYDGFPLMYHWRELPDGAPLPEELADVDRAVAYWGGGPEIRRRIEALGRASSSIALFLEYIPRNLHEWLGSRVSAGDEAVLGMVEDRLGEGIAFMNGRGLLHFDAHFRNILTDGRRLYFTDFGLALSSRFRLSPSEARFFDRHRSYDRRYATSYLVNWLLTDLYGLRGPDREARVRAIAAGEHPTGIPPTAAAILTRHAPLTTVMNDFQRAFLSESRRTPYPGWTTP